MNFKEGDIIESARWPEPVKIDLIETSLTDYIRIVGAGVHTKTHIDDLISKNEIADIKIKAITSDFSANPESVFLSLEAKRYRYASLYDPLLAMNISKIDPLPHQIDAVYGYVLKLPRIRFLIADDPGAGKTIMAGLVIKELKIRKLVKNLLIVSPGHLKDQWRRELKEKFCELFTIIDRNFMDSFYSENVWTRERQIITSIDFAKQDDIMNSLRSCHFDLIIVDEAHKMSAYRYGDKLDKTSRYRLGEVLSNISEHLIFLTATPHKGDPENFRLFIDLLEPGFFATTDMLSESIKNLENPLFIRRIKEDLKSFDGKPLFLPRYVKTVPFRLSTDSPLEHELYNELSKYVNEEYNKALTKNKKRNIAFALVILQRRLASSTYALYKSLERRKRRLTELLSMFEEGKVSDKAFDFEDVEDMSEEERWKLEQMWETLSVAENRQDLEDEIKIIDGLIEKAKEIIDNESEIKIRELKNTLDDLSIKFPDEKVLIFTESKDTLEYLEKKISNKWNYKVNVIHGGMDLEQRIKAEGIFKNDTQVMVATEAAGEGINLQFCHLMINFDIPWNPNRLEQRMGRVHRYGQPKEVFVFNLVAEDTREGQVLTKLFEKLERIKEAMGSDKVFDVLSEIMYGKNLSQLLVEAAANSRNLDEILSEIDIVIDEDYISKVKDNLGESLATHFIDYTRIKEMADRAKEYRLIPEYTEAFFRKAFMRAGGKLRERKDDFITVQSIPFELKNIADEDTFRKAYGSMQNSYPKVTFDKDIAFKNSEAEFISFGHPLFEGCLVWIESTMLESLKQGAVFEDPDRKLNGFIVFFEGEIKDGNGKIAGKRLFSFYVDEAGKIESINPAILWDLVEAKEKINISANIDDIKNQAFGNVMQELEGYRKELSAQRIKECEIKEKYGIKSLEFLILKLDDDLLDLNLRKERGDNVDIVIRNKEEAKRGYERNWIELRDSIIKDKILTFSNPSFVGLIAVKPMKTTYAGMHSDAVIEMIGMDVTINYEISQLRKPLDVSKENLGFDIRSTDKDENIRYIEVKARAGVDEVALTINEWFKAKRFGDDYYLYVVFNAATHPELMIIRNPASVLQPEERIEIVRYIVSKDQINERAIKANI